MPVRPGVTTATLSINGFIISGLFLVSYAENLRHREYLRIMRDWYPLPLMLLAYREMGWFAPTEQHVRYELSWIKLDRLLLNDWGLRTILESLGPLLPSALEVSYSLVYAIAPFCMAWIYYRQRFALTDQFLSTFLPSIFLSYALFPFFPSEPPRTVFPDQDLPTVLTIFREFNLGLVGNYGIHLSVFPSAHCSGAFGAALAMREAMPNEPYIWRTLLALATSIAIATVYGRYHYAADAIAGICVALVAWKLGKLLTKPALKAESAILSRQ